MAVAIVFLPLLAAAIAGFFGRVIGDRGAQIVTCGALLLSMALGIPLFREILAQDGARVVPLASWIVAGGVDVEWSLRLDTLSGVMIVAVTIVSAMVHVYSVGYMAHDTGIARFMAYLSLFTFFMLMLVTANDFVQLFFGWEGVGLMSYLLIGFWYDRASANDAAIKAFIVNRVGDFGFALGIFAVFVIFGSLDYDTVFGKAPAAVGTTINFLGWQVPSLTLACILLFIGAMGKSAQLGLHTWLPDAMEGPTPVSALIHAATMVTAGVYLIGRMHPIYDLAFWSHSTAALIGAVTALVAATIAIVQTDIKRVLAYSTMSQIGYMFLGVGLGAYAAGFYHLLAHAFFKALLFMSAGNVIHAMNDEQDMRRFGGLWGQMRVTSVCFLIGSLALVGIFPLVGFFSKEVVLGDAFSKPDQGGFPQAMWAVGFVTAVLTGFYTGRMWWIAFWREAARDRPVEHPHEAAPVMLVPVVILTVLTCIGGALQLNAGFDVGWRKVEDFLAPAVGILPWAPRGLEWIPTAATLLLGGVAFLAAYRFYVSGAWRPWSQALPWLQRLLERKYYADEIYDALFVRTMDTAAEGGDRLLEEPVLVGAPTDVGLVAQAGAGTLAVIQNGYFRTYVLVFVGGAVVALALIVIAKAAG